MTLDTNVKMCYNKLYSKEVQKGTYIMFWRIYVVNEEGKDKFLCETKSQIILNNTLRDLSAFTVKVLTYYPDGTVCLSIRKGVSNV